MSTPPIDDSTTPRDPLLDDPSGTRDEREFDLASDGPLGPRIHVEPCPLCPGEVRPVTPRAADGSRRFECDNCAYKARRNWALYEG
ncbi:hypothetical protein ACI8AA_23130 [Geodermatophilus sp. SYSU D01180]